MSVILDTHARALEEMAGQRLDLLVIGGGIVGAGVLRDAAMRGLRAALVEQHDFAFGTSSRSSRLLHGGIRYLAQGDIRLVREASVEKRILSRVAGHLAEPLAFTFPTFRDQEHWKLWQLKIGVKLYDALCGWRNLGESQWLSREQALKHLPMLRGDELTGAVRYFDALTNDARLVIDTLRSAHQHGAMLARDVKFERATQQPGGLWECVVTDLLRKCEIKLHTRALVTAGGAWSGQLPYSRLPLRLTKGVHLVIDHVRLPVTDAVVMTEGRRVLFAIPWGKRIILGTTDTDFAGDLDDVRCDCGDIDYILDITNRHFPAARLTPGDIRSTWAGVRPLIADKGHPSDISRSHVIREVGENWLEIGGGKLTTYRLIAQQAVDRIMPALRGRRIVCRTADDPLIPRVQTDGISSIIPPPVTRQAVEHYCRNEWAWRLEDVMLRRSSWHHYVDNPAEVAQQVASWMAEIFAWDQATVVRELDAFLAANSCKAGRHC